MLLVGREIRQLKNPKNELMQFVAGIVMLAVGLFIFSQKVVVTSGWFGSMYLGGIRVSSGLVMIPFIAGIVWMFASDGSFASKVFTVLSVILIITSVILTTNIYLTHMSLFEWIVILVLIFGGAGFTGKVLFAGGSGKREASKKNKNKDVDNNTVSSIDEELENIRRNMK